MARALLTPGMIGCYLSHRTCWQRCVDGGHDAVIVFEDDAVIAPDFKAKLLGAMEDVPDDCKEARAERGVQNDGGWG